MAIQSKPICPEDIDLAEIFYQLLLEDIQTQIDYYGSYREYLLATR